VLFSELFKDTVVRISVHYKHEMMMMMMMIIKIYFQDCYCKHF